MTVFISDNVEPGTQVITDGWSGYSGIEDYIRVEHVIGERPAHEIMVCAKTHSALSGQACVSMEPTTYSECFH